MEPIPKEFIGKMPNFVNGAGTVMFGFIVSVFFVYLTGMSNSNFFPLLNLACALAIWLAIKTIQEKKKKEQRGKVNTHR